MTSNEKIIVNLRAANSRLWKELLRLDKTEPICGILITRRTARGLLAVVPKRNYHLRQRLEIGIERYDNASGLASREEIAQELEK